MKISGFTMCKNAEKLYYPVKQSIMSALPLVDEFIVALGDNEEGDNTKDEILSINDPKIKIIDTKWDLEKFPNGMENAHQTDIALKQCKGDWCLYLQADEVLHENDLPKIRNRCEELLENKEIDGMVFKYRHFWGDYDHFHNNHGWYKKEIRIVRNDKDIHSYKSAQSFRKLYNFDGLNYRTEENVKKLNVAKLDAYIYHYGWVRPPKLMRKKNIALDTIHKGEKGASEIHGNLPEEFDYGNMLKIPVFRGTHPSVMKSWIEKFDWGEKLRYDNNKKLERKKFKHEMFKYKLISVIENVLGITFGSKNYIQKRA